MSVTRTLCLTAVLLVIVAPASADQVTIHRDPWGVPHIIADTEEAGFYGLGYAQAEDQLKFILTMFLAGRGEMAAAFGEEPTRGLGGPPTANAIPTDIQSRMWRHVEEAQAGWERLSPQLQRNYAHHVAGMEAWMREHRTAPRTGRPISSPGIRWSFRASSSGPATRPDRVSKTARAVASNSRPSTGTALPAPTNKPPTSGSWPRGAPATTP